jgi:hypothetical protein
MTCLGVVACAGLVSGTLDITATSILVKTQGGHLKRLFQGIASGALGTSAFQGGKKTAAAGLLFHFIIAFVAATVFYLLSRRLTILLDNPFLSGAFYGAAVHLVMNRIVVPLSAAPKREFSAKAFLTQLIIHVFFVGLPIAFIVSYLSR